MAAAVEDFSAAVTAMPEYGDGWKRRGQARAALGQAEGALADFTRALELVAEPGGRAEALAERGTLLQKRRDLRRAAADLERAAALDGRSKQVLATAPGAFREAGLIPRSGTLQENGGVRSSAPACRCVLGSQAHLMRGGRTGRSACGFNRYPAVPQTARTCEEICIDEFCYAAFEERAPACKQAVAVTAVAHSGDTCAAPGARGRASC